jgi:hypothetical protein
VFAGKAGACPRDEHLKVLIPSLKKYAQSYLRAMVFTLVKVSVIIDNLCYGVIMLATVAIRGKVYWNSRLAIQGFGAKMSAVDVDVTEILD